MYLTIRPYAISGVALASAGILVALPVTTPQHVAPEVRIAAHVDAPTPNALLSANVSAAQPRISAVPDLLAAQPSISAVPDVSAASIAVSAEELLGAIAIIGQATGVAIEEVITALGNVPSIAQGALEDLASGQSPVDVLRGVGMRVNINVRNMFVFPLRTLQGLPAPFGGTGGVFDQLEEFVIAVSNAIANFLAPPIQGLMSASQANLSLAETDTVDVRLAEESTTGVIEGSGPTVADDLATKQRQAVAADDALDNSDETVTGLRNPDTVTVTTEGAGVVQSAAAPESQTDDTEKLNGATDLTDGNMAEPGNNGTNADSKDTSGLDAPADTDVVDRETVAGGRETESTEASEPSE
jgi:hypothetical protein